jgi:hypothetical protein
LAYVRGDDFDCVATNSPLDLFNANARWDFRWKNDSGPLVCDGKFMYNSAMFDDAFDQGFRIAVVGFNFNKIANNVVANLTDKRMVVGPFVTLPDLWCLIEYRVIVGRPTLRLLVSFSNVGNTTMSFTARLVSPVGADKNVRINATSTGNLVFNKNTRWLITDDKGVAARPVVTHVLFGRDRGGDNVHNPDDTLFDNTAAAGLTANFTLNLPPGIRKTLLFFAEMHAPPGRGGGVNALDDVTIYDQIE